MRIIVHPTARHVAESAADLIAADVVAGASNIGLAGGSTPEAAYRLLPDRAIDWSGVTFWLSDERWVPVDHPESNAGMAKRTFVDAVGAHLVLPDYHAGHAAGAASAYETELFEIFGEGHEPGLVLLGIGADGHTASLFPGTDALELTRSGYVANWIPEKDSWRLTATMPLLWEASHVVFLVTGEGKARVLRQILDRGVEYPAQRVAAGAKKVTWLLDAAAASALDRPDA
jgi:6-phosphogluconolactonase